MKKKKNSMKRAFSILASLLMLFSLITPGFAAAESNTKVSHSLKNSLTTSLSKVNETLLSEFEDKEKVTFLVKFKESADLESVVKDAKSNAQSKKLTAGESRFQQRSVVVSTLKSVAHESQQNVIAFLEDETKNGHVENFQSFHIVNGMAVTATKEIAEKIAGFSEVEKILPNEERQLVEAVAEESVPSSNLEAIEWNVDRVNAPETWALGIDGTGTVVGSLDTGAQWDHPALKEKYRGYDAGTGNVNHQTSFFDATASAREVAYDDNGHGTHVTGTMVGGELDGSNQVGVAPGAKWIAAKVFDAAGNTTDSILLSAAQWMMAPGGRVDMAPDVVNNSWGGGSGLDEWYRDTVRAWRAADIFPEFAAGNTTLSNPGGPGSVAAPSNYPESFAVGATDNNDVVAGFSLRGPSPYGEIKPDISAPGVGIRSTLPGGGYGNKNGTSMASPAVSGIAALLRQVNANLSVDEMEEILLTTATPLTDSKYPESPNHGYGHGLVDAFAAVSSIIDGLGTIEGQVTTEGEDTEDPTFEHSAPTVISAATELNLTVQAKDNISISLVELSYQNNEADWQTIEASQISGGPKSGIYSVTIPGEEIDAGTLSYKWLIKDIGNNEVNSEEYVVAVTSGITIGYFEDFEEEPFGWTSFGNNNTWEWGVPTSGPNNAWSGEKVYATNLAGPYLPNSDATLVMPLIDLPEGDAYLKFQNWQDLEGVGLYYWDFAYVLVSTDKQEWTELLKMQGKKFGWHSVEVDLSDYSGQEIYIGFKIKSDSLGKNEGIYIDDVSLSNVSMSNDSSNEINDEISLISEQPKTETLQNSVLLPLGANVSVLETGNSVATNPDDGTYSLLHTTGEFTVQAEAYGFHSNQQTAVLEENSIVQADFTLVEKVASTISGSITSESTGEAITGATLLLVEDANITPVETDDKGNYSITAYEGTYSLKVMAPKYHSKEVEVTIGEDPLEVNLTLEPYYTYPGGEIGYDDGTAENAKVFYDAGNGWAVKMSLPEGKDSAIVTDGKFRFWNTEWPVPGGTQFAVEVWDATGSDGLPGTKLAGPISATALRDDTWTSVDLSDHNIEVNDDFYMVYIQTQANPNAPGLASDENSQHSGRSYQYVGGTWEQTIASEGNYMIRANVAYGIHTPIITTPSEGKITNDTSITIEGTASPTTTIKLLHNNNEALTKEVGDEGQFIFTTELEEGENVFTAVSTINGEVTGESDPVSVLLDTVAPELTIDSPQDGEITERETVTVEGTVSDENLDYVELNGERVTIADGSYSKRIMLDEGVNTITVYAIDLANNETTKTISVTSQIPEAPSIPVIENLQPATDQNLHPGDEVEISFTSESTGGEASFAIQLPSQLGPQSSSGNPMVEVEPGVYKGTWIAPDINVQDMAIVVEFTDTNGLKVVEEATGKLSIIQEEASMPVIENLKPSTDQSLQAGDEIEVAFTSESVGGEANFTVQLSNQTGPQSTDKYPMEEVEPGVYKGTWTAPNIAVEDLIIAVELTDTAGNKTTEEAAGKITIVLEEPIVPSDPVIENLHPSTDKTVKPGDEVEISFTSDSKDGEASYTVQLPSQIGPKSTSGNTMEEIEPGVYKGTWIVPNASVEELTIVVELTDKVGNKTTEEATGKLTIVVEDEEPEVPEMPIIKNLQPSTGQYVVAGDEVEISFTSNSEGGEAGFTIQLPAEMSAQSASKIPMEEVEPGVYKGKWKVPTNLNLRGAVIQVELTDSAGQKISEEANGKIVIYPDELERISGKDRYLTAIEVSQKGWAKSETIVIARGDDYADALAGVPFAYQLNAPILLTVSNRIYDETLAEIKRLGAKNVTILGGQNAIDDSVAKALEKAGLKVKRIAGKDRFETAAKIATEVAPDGATKVVVANGMDFPDALSVASHAARAGLPIILTQDSKLPDYTRGVINALGVTETIIVGGESAVKENVADELPKATRLAGADRYETNIEIAEHFGIQSKHLYVATGKTYADALTGAVLAAKDESAVLLVHDRVPEVVTTYLTDNKTKHLTIFGGETAVSKKVASELEKLLQ